MKHQILIIDDSRADVDLVRLALEEAGIDAEVVVASGGREAIALLATITPSVAIVDIRMPWIDGYEVLRRIRSEARMKAMPVIMMSTSAAESDRNRSRELGANAYWIKPNRFEDLLEMVRCLPDLCR